MFSFSPLPFSARMIIPSHMPLPPSQVPPSQVPWPYVPIPSADVFSPVHLVKSIQSWPYRGLSRCVPDIPSSIPTYHFAILIHWYTFWPRFHTLFLSCSLPQHHNLCLCEVRFDRHPPLMFAMTHAHHILTVLSQTVVYTYVTDNIYRTKNVPLCITNACCDKTGTSPQMPWPPQMAHNHWTSLSTNPLTHTNTCRTQKFLYSANWTHMTYSQLYTHPNTKWSISQ